MPLSDRWREIERILDIALEQAPSEWASILDAHCGSDAELRREVEALLGRYTSAQRILAEPPALAADAAIAGATPAAIRPGSTIGAYRVVRQIGEGGTAQVFLAERSDGQFTRQVAIKFLRVGYNTEVDQRSFHAEQQILASLNHPNIAQFFDGGLTAEGRPYLVLELVDGAPIDRYCALHALSQRARLEMYLHVIDAMQYAHRNLVVHRDLKPANILVTDDGRVLLLDFGLAKLLEARPQPGATIRTLHHWMTPEYAAPEQVRGEPPTTLTDVYQLGAVLYELLTGDPPHGRRGGQRDQLLNAILREEPARKLRGDLDAIVRKALQKIPEERYASAQALAEDIRRHLSGHPVMARRQTLWYSARSFVRRHPVALAAPAALIIGVAAYSTMVGVQRARVQRALAQATLEAQTASQVTDLMLTLFEASEGGSAFADTVSARRLLQRGYARAGALTGEPLVRAQLLDLIGQISLQIGDDAQAHAALTEAYDIRRRDLGAAHELTLATAARLVRARKDTGTRRED